MKFRDYFSWKNFLFATFLMAIMILFAIRQSNNMVKVSFADTEVYVSSARYSLTIPYDMIASSELTALPEPGERGADAYDDDILRAGVWTNDVWGEYYIVADLDVMNCIVTELEDGRIFVFNRKNDASTAEDYETLQSYLY